MQDLWKYEIAEKRITSDDHHSENTASNSHPHFFCTQVGNTERITAIRLGSHLVFSPISWFWYLTYSSLSLKTNHINNLFISFFVLRTALWKAAAGEEMAWVLVSVCGPSPHYIPSVASVSRSINWGGIGVNDDNVFTKHHLENDLSWALQQPWEVG